MNQRKLLPLILNRYIQTLYLLSVLNIMIPTKAEDFSRWQQNSSRRLARVIQTRKCSPLIAIYYIGMAIVEIVHVIESTADGNELRG